MPSTTACCNKDIFAVARGMTIFEMVLTYLSLLLGVANVKDGQPRAESSVNQLRKKLISPIYAFLLAHIKN